MATGILAAASIIGAVGTGYSVYQGEKQRKEAKKAAAAQQAEIDKENKRALAERKELIDTQREQLLTGGGSSLRGSITGSGGAGLTGKIKDEVLG